MASDLKAVLEAFAFSATSPWDRESVNKLDNIDTVNLLGRNEKLLVSDFKMRISTWVGQSIITPDMLGKMDLRVMLTLKRRCTYFVENLGQELSEPEKNACVAHLLEICESVLSTMEQKRRSSISVNMRRELIYSFPGSAFCWICGFRFPKSTVELFLRSNNASGVSAIPLVDYLYPRGARNSDQTIAVDHVTPISRGGIDELSNLRIACGYCNRVKSDGISIFENRDNIRVVDHPQEGSIYTPQPFWVARTLAIVGKCTVCERTVKQTPLRVAPMRGAFASNPFTLRVYCSEHDPLASTRFISPSFILN
ncbi:HNH endonuclease [Rhodococcus fascians]|nr:HNH endonuclease [Rhodococcus fascians]MBY4116310.1 HNH endonuclease [Rhodococcus fascians]